VIRLGAPANSTEGPSATEVVAIEEPRLGFDYGSFESQLESLWFQRKAVLADGRSADAAAQLDRIRAFCQEEGVTRLEYLSGALVAEARRFLNEGNQDQVFSSLEFAESFDPGRPQVHLARAAAHWKFGGGVIKTGSELLRALEAAWVRGTRDLSLVHQIAFVLGLALAAAILLFSLFMLLRYQVPFRHEVEEWFGRMAGSAWGQVVGWAALGLPLLVWFGAGWAAFYWIVITFRFMRRSERLVAMGLLLVTALTLPFYNVTIALYGTTADPAVRATLSAVGGEYDPDRILKLRQLVDAHPDDPVYHFLLAQLYVNGRYFEEAFEEYKVAIELRPDLVSAFINIGNIFYTTGQHGEAIANYTRALERDPNSFLAHFNLHVAQSEDFRFKEAEASLAAARKLDSVRVASMLSSSGAGDRPRVLDATLHMASIWESAVGGTQTLRFAPPGNSPALAGRIPSLFNAISVVSLLGLGACLTLAFLTRRQEPARRCIRCGRAFCHHCKSAREAKEYCSQCLHLFVLGDGLEPGTKQRKLFEIECYERRWRRVRKISTVVLPGAGQLLRGRTAWGLALVVLWLAGIIAARPAWLGSVGGLIGADPHASAFLRAGDVPVVYGANPLAFVALLALPVLWLIGNLWRRKRWAT
jgi:tetratricopeptide (TPR) repeat protein